MKYTFCINRYVHDALGRPDIRFACADCGNLNMALAGFFWRAALVASQVNDPETAASEFMEKLNSRQFESLFFKRTTAKSCENTCCNCTGAARGRLLRALERHNQIESDGGAA